MKIILYMHNNEGYADEAYDRQSYAKDQAQCTTLEEPNDLCSSVIIPMFTEKKNSDCYILSLLSLLRLSHD